MKARDVMTHCVVTIPATASVRDAIAKMVSHHVSGMPVVGPDARLAGIITEADLLRRAELGTEHPRRRWLELLVEPGSLADDYSRAHGVTVEDVMTRDVVTVTPGMPLDKVVSAMEAHGVKRVPVIDDGRLVGIISRADLTSALARLLGGPDDVAASDESIRRKIVNEMKRQSWCPSYSIAVAVREGRVRFSGTILDDRGRRALRILAENVAGVRAVEDELLTVEPLAGSVFPVI